jgi:lipopolysaccharide export LptBFGC system permease protein LptF
MMLGWLGWTIVYAVVVWGIGTVYGLLEPRLKNANRRAQEVAAVVRFVIPLGVAFLIGFRLRTWWWALSPFLVIVVTMLAISIIDYLRRPPSERQQVAAGLILAIGATLLDAALATLAAIAGVVVGRWMHGG